MATTFSKDDVWDNFQREESDKALQQGLTAQQALREAGDPQRLALDEIARTQLGIELDARRRKPNLRVFTGNGGEDWVESRDPPFELAEEEPMSIAAE
jgi:hypothetical protein